MINIAELLKDVPKGMKLYSPLFGEVNFVGIDKQSDYPINVTDCKGNGKSFTEFGIYFADHPDAECLLFPSKDCRTWKWWELPVKPKYKVGDKVIYNSRKRTITFMDEKYYYFDGGCAGCRIDKQDELLSPAPKLHYDIANFKPKQWVLVRDDDEWEWALTRFSYLSNGSASLFVCINGASFQQCIPFEGNEHLLGTTDMCDEMYINW